MTKKLKQTRSLKAGYEFLRNFPDHSISTATSPISPEFKAEVEANARLLGFVLSIQSSGVNSVLINNRPVQDTELTLFDISRLLRVDLRTHRKLLDLGLSSESATRVLWDGNLQLHTEAKAVSGVLKTGPESGRVYLNDVAEDKKYSDWSSDIEDLFLGGPNVAVALNLFNLILVGDVKTAVFWNTLQSLALMHQAGWPIRFGLILTNQENLQLNELLLSIVKNLKAEDENLPMLYLADLNEEVTEEKALKAFKDVCYYHCSLKQDQEIIAARRGVEFCKVTGVCDSQLLLNGRLLDPGSESSLRRLLITEIGQERQLIGFLLMNRVLKPPLEKFFEEGKHSRVIERLNPCITVTDPKTLSMSPVRLQTEGFILENNPDQVKKLTITLGLAQTKLDLLSLAIQFLEAKPDLSIRFRILFRLPVSGDGSYLLFLAHLIASGALETLKTALSSPHLALDLPENEVAFRNLLDQQKIFEQIPAETFVLTRGRLIDAHCFHDYRDFDLLMKTELSRLSVEADALEIVTDIDTVSPARISTVLDLAGTALMQTPKLLPFFHQYREYPIPRLAGKHTSLDFSTESPVQVFALLNPLKPESQKLLAILAWLQDLGASVRVSLNPQIVYAEGEHQLQRWYAYLIPQSLQESLSLHLSETVTVTLGLDVPEKWLVYSSEAELDLDNLRSEGEVRVVYELDSLVIDGSCAQLIYGYTTEPPAGLQLVLGNSTTSFSSDTSVMRTVGYYQFKASPGVYTISLKEGRSQELYEMFHTSTLVLDSLTPPLQNLAVSKKEGHETEQLLGDEAESVASSDRINVFTLASGHLYERLMRIMILSVLSNTSSKVKFWILANFLSPKFRSQMAEFAEMLGFEYELVTYAWPFWLFPQKEKQRLIWAYKILFLDVLFPLSVPKIIYIDADQIVRSDIKELWELDLHGAPYAYTPFCDSNVDTEGFRFWKSGFWKKHLNGLPYHISALYVIDLNRFRSLSAGDTLRFLYENMARDPNSLANLDQDLPNYAQHQVPIFSLPQEWLWCATWCSIESLSTAKTIDLCNNPLTKEPKIQVAKRLIPEWSQYDQVLQEFDKARNSGTPFIFERKNEHKREDL